MTGSTRLTLIALLLLLPVSACGSGQQDDTAPAGPPPATAALKGCDAFTTQTAANGYL
ncbi:MAG: hypothetical protein QOJ32_1326, partial [Frankiaceae bacterium]|nr:hypothetical protein [Frankiaceae bacterium]